MLLTNFSTIKGNFDTNIKSFALEIIANYIYLGISNKVQKIHILSLYFEGLNIFNRVSAFNIKKI